MAQIGDIVIGAREMFPDPPASVISPPSASGITLGVTGTGGILPAGTNYFVFTFINAAGETTPSAEMSISVSAGQNVTVALTLPTGVTAFRAYHGTVSGGEFEYYQNTSSPAIITGVGGVASTPPLNNTAWNPDADGAAVSASTVYRWLNDALGKAALAAGGIQDVTGIPTVNAVGQYQLMGRWIKFTHAWFDGWLMSFSDNGNFYYHNASTGISWMLSMQQVTTRNVLEVWPQADRTAGTASVNGVVAATDSNITIVNPLGWVLPLGLALLGTPAAGEIISYSTMTSTQFTSCIRGYGGTVPQAWPIGTPVKELNLRMKGRRMPVAYSPGQSLATVDIPYDWENSIKFFMLGMYRLLEQEEQAGLQLIGQFEKWCVSLARQNRQMAGPVQVGIATREIWGGSTGGGWFVS